MGVMSELDMYGRTIEAVRKEMAGEPAEVQIEYRMDCVLRELDEFVAMALNPETVDLIIKHKLLVGQIMSRAQLVASFLLERGHNPGALRVVKNA